MMEGSIPPPSTTTTSTTSSITTIPTSSSSTVFRPRKSEDWNEYRTAIESLYRDNQLKLRDVKRIMERDYNFVASEKQYKDRLAAWHVRKNIKAKEVHVMIRKQQKRAARGKQTGFRVAGQEVDSKRISRFVRRYGSNMEANNSREDPPHSPQGHQIIQPVQPVQPIQATSPEPETPSDMSYFTPPPEERAMTLSPSTETPSHFHDDPPEPVRNPGIGSARSLSVSSGTMTNDITKPMTDGVQGPDGWMTLEMFQEKLLKLSRTLDQSMSRFVPAEDRSHQPSNSDQHSRSIGQ
ncbi:Clr5 domain-containing protein [Aspergillus luchuensis]|uniref:Clr5 domain-containing protein n=3 Tax=Aspergillus subgen. Circumdati TaxID=2720871 RepID=A0A8G1VL83_9EURO|nr:hypothetical protein BO85DRAFT_50799 [Aspergillus piperis CBS 112811]XP_041547484.1 uncharacterized protein AKAW2_70600S [Aspergillus luchuensis]OJZ86404.1 hypothetical protein ASPFODRAFT_599965 [Aspergillus luchuensis CBS 106.47]RAH56465.1 hypothetical protein BO85DRAFT_50799 [Aspergillus piperis CBS 112811]BCS03722.1 hypothetical protein AKAW2_70600S [Aspergillus luchuensis]BCS15341.1 hypothetical protein ALUC_70574S [Aspergillus luchuensis]